MFNFMSSCQPLRRSCLKIRNYNLLNADVAQFTLYRYDTAVTVQLGMVSYGIPLKNGIFRSMSRNQPNDVSVNPVNWGDVAVTATNGSNVG